MARRLPLGERVAQNRRRQAEYASLSTFPPMPLPAALSRVAKLFVRSRPARSGLLFAATLAVVAMGALLPSPKTAPIAALERKAFDRQMQWLRALSPRPLEKDIVLIGIDADSEKRFEEPLVLWHKHYARVLEALARTEPAAVGVDIVLPERSYNDIMPGLDSAMVKAIFQLRQRTALIYVRGVVPTGPDAGRYSPMLPIYLRALDPEKNFGIDQALKDPDDVSRRFSERELGEGQSVPTFAGQILRALRRPVQEGLIDYSVGGDLGYVPMQDVIGWLEQGDTAKLKAAFDGRIVLFGSLGVDRDRWVLPVEIATWEKLGREYELGQPGVVVHLQVLRSHLANGLIQPAPVYVNVLLCILAACAVWLRFKPWRFAAGALVVPAALVALNLGSIRTSQLIWPVAAVTVTLWIALLARGLMDAVESIIERTRLKRNFRGSVSPAVLNEIMTGGLDPESDARTAEVCVIFSDIRGFTTLSEEMSPDLVMSVLQRYFDRMVKSVHRFDGTIDKFIGDGMMILFGAPRQTPDPCTDAVRCALDMLNELDELNVEFERDGLPKLEIGIGINYGKVVVGNIGSTERHNYSAIGDAVNVAARIEGQTKELGRRILITESVVSRIGARFDFEPLGARLVKGHSPVKVWGIRATRTKRAIAGEQEQADAPAAPVNGGHA